MNSIDTVKAMLVYAQVVQHGSFAEAARRMGLTRAVVSYHVKRLETQLDVQLLNRNTRNLSMTPAGERLYERSQRIAHEAQTATDEMTSLSAQPIGRIRMTCSVNWGQKRIVPLMVAFREQYPAIEVELILTDEVVNLVEAGVDIAIRGAPLKDSDLISQKLAIESSALVAAPRLWEGKSQPETPSELSALDWVVYTPAASTFTLQLDGTPYRISMKGPVHTNNALARLSFVLAGQGVAKFPLSTVEPYIKTGELVQLLPTSEMADIDIFAVYPRKSHLTRLLVDHLKQSLDA